jgi:ribosomal 50S subunit-recycling heat shock protein
MRLDKYLMVSRIIKRRTVSNNACDTEKVSVNGRVVKASYNVKVGDVIEVTFGERTLKVRVKDIKEHTLKSNAAELYEWFDGVGVLMFCYV